MLTHNMAGVGGSYMRSHSLAKNLAALGHHVTLLAGNSTGRWSGTAEQSEGVAVLTMPDPLRQRVRHGGLSPIDIAGRLAHVRRHCYDVVHGFDHRPSVSLPALACRRRHHATYVSDWADLWGRGGIAETRGALARWTLGRIDHFWERRLRQRADGVTVICNYLHQLCLRLEIRPAAIRVIPPGANVDAIRPLPKDAMRHKYDLPVESPIAVYIGYSPYDSDLLAETFIELARRDDRTLLLMTGGRPKGFDHSVRAAGLDRRVIFMGAVPYRQLGEVLACGDVMLLPYTNRPINLGRYPNKFGDYLAAGRPVLTNPTGDLGATVRAEGVGIVADEAPGAMADAAQVLFRNRDLREEMGRRARLLAETKMSWRGLAYEVSDFFRTLLGAK